MLGLIAAERTIRPSHFSGLQLWLDASVESSLGNTATAAGGASNNGPVKFWGDLSGNSRNASRNAADSVVPTLLSGSRNGLSVLRFDGGDFLSTVSYQAFPSKRGTLFAVFDNRKASGYGTIATTYNGTTPVFQWYVVTSGTNYGWWAGGAVANKTSLNAQGWQVVAARRTSNTSLEYWIGLSSQSLTITDNQPAANVLHIAATSGGAETATCDMGEFLSFDRDLSTAEMNAIVRYLGNKWGVTL